MKRQIALMLVLAIALSASVQAAFPKPAVVQKVGEWTLTVKFEAPQQVTLRLPGRAAPERFWYLILSLTNESSLPEVAFFPACELVTDNFELIPAGIGVPKGVFDAIKLKHQGGYPFLESLDFADNRVNRGPDNTRDVVIIWKDFNPKAKEVSFFIGGMSNETAAIVHPAKTDANGNPEQVFLQKTLQLRYNVGADARLRDLATLKLIEQEWVMR
jgi:hypothetical protein